MSKKCEISACVDVNLQPVTCFEINLKPVTCLDLCIQGKGLGLLTCDIAFVDYFQRETCTLDITNVNVFQATATVTSSGSTDTIYYKFLAADGTVVKDWSTSNVFTAPAIGQYLVQVQDVFGCADAEFFEIIELAPLTIDYQSASSLTITSGTTVASTIPADVLPGDFMVLHLMHRDVLTPPAGWTLIGTSGTVGFGQRQSALYRIAQAGDEGTIVTSTQATSQRFLSHIQAFRSNGTIGIINNAFASSAAAGLNLPELPSTAENQMAVVSMTNVYGATAGDTEVLAPTGYTQTTLPNATFDKRLGCAYKNLIHPETISGRFVVNTDDIDRTAFSMILGAS